MTNEPSVLLFFIDGLGIGERGPFNPFDQLDDAAPLAVFQGEPSETFLGRIVIATDPRLGVEDVRKVPQARQAILTGINARLLSGTTSRASQTSCCSTSSTVIRSSGNCQPQDYAGHVCQRLHNPF